ncbi:hypothetical protein [Streptomyces sp. cg40]|uniref:hypothetical protein n=1 Tax=Streptomyces sp. cg40 TaxID=3419764 RepID=UPI003D070508
MHGRRRLDLAALVDDPGVVDSRAPGQIRRRGEAARTLVRDWLLGDSPGPGEAGQDVLQHAVGRGGVGAGSERAAAVERYVCFGLARLVGYGVNALALVDGGHRHHAGGRRSHSC